MLDSESTNTKLRFQAEIDSLIFLQWSNFQERIGLANHAEADQLVLAIYVTSVWCSILKQRPELSHPIPDQCDFESYMKTWIFHPHFENFSKVFVASCCQIMESSEHMKTTCSKVETQTPETDHHETPKPSSLPASLPEVQDTIPAEPAPSLQIHPSWRASPHFNPYMGCMNTVPFVPLNTHGFSSHSEHHQNYPPMFHYSPVTPIPTAPSAELPSTTRAPKRKQSKQQKLPSIHELVITGLHYTVINKNFRLVLYVSRVTKRDLDQVPNTGSE